MQLKVEVWEGQGEGLEWCTKEEAVLRWQLTLTGTGSQGFPHRLGRQMSGIKPMVQTGHPSPEPRDIAASLRELEHKNAEIGDVVNKQAVPDADTTIANLL